MITLRQQTFQLGRRVEGRIWILIKIGASDPDPSLPWIRILINNYSPSADFPSREEGGGQDLDPYQDWSLGSGSIIALDPDTSLPCIWINHYPGSGSPSMITLYQRLSNSRGEWRAGTRSLSVLEPRIRVMGLTNLVATKMVNNINQLISFCRFLKEKIQTRIPMENINGPGSLKQSPDKMEHYPHPVFFLPLVDMNN